MFLVYNHRLFADARIADGAPESWLFSRLVTPAPVRAVAINRPEGADMVSRQCIVPAMCLIRRLQVLTGTAAVLVIPPLLVDREGVDMVRVRQLKHGAPYVDVLARLELPELEHSIWIGGRIGRIGLHPAVSTPRSALILALALIIVVQHAFIILCHVHEVPVND